MAKEAKTKKWQYIFLNLHPKTKTTDMETEETKQNYKWWQINQGFSQSPSFKQKQNLDFRIMEHISFTPFGGIKTSNTKLREEIWICKGNENSSKCVATNLKLIRLVAYTLRRAYFCLD